MRVETNIRAAQTPQWWGPAGQKTVVDKMDVRVGGEWRFVQTEPGGEEYAFRGTYKVLDPPHRIVYTFEYEPLAGHILEETIMFEPQADGTTKLTATARYANLADLEGMVSMGMESGARASQDRLATLVED